MNWKRFLVAMFATLLLLPSVIMAQSIVTGAINGTVTDPSGAVIAGASVTLSSTTTGASLTAETNASGGYSFGLVKPGTYTLSVSKSGFKQTTESVEVALGETSVFNAKLELGSGSITVEVTGQGALLQTENANISTSIETAEIENLPNPGGDLTGIAQTAPGVTMNTTGGGYGNFSAFGLPGTANLFTVNGNDYNDPFLNLNNSGASNLLLGSNEIQEVSVISNAYTGQYGRQAGAQIDYATKSGGNAFHGDAVYYYNAGGMNAGDFFNGYEREVNNQWAASIGGPVIKDKIFFFVNTEGLRYSLASGGGNIFYPTTAFENFITAKVQTLPTALTAGPFYQNIFNLYNASPAYAAANANPQAGSCGSLAGSGISQGGMTDACAGSVFQSSPNGNKEWLLSGRVDWNIDENNKLFGRTKFDRGTQPTYTDPVSSVFNIQSVQPQQEGQANYTHIFSPNVVNNIVGSVLYYSAIFQSPNLSAATAQFPGLFSLNDIPFACIGQGCGDDTGFSIFPQGRNVTQWGVVDDLSITRGNHSFKMGVNFRRDDVSDYTASEGLIPAISLNALDFSNDVLNPTGNVGDAVGQAFAINSRQPIAFYSVGLYFQDEYRVNSRLKLTLALRADRNSSGVCQSNCGSAPPIPFQDQSHNAALPFDSITNPGSHAILPGVERVVFQPRFGVAWTPFGDKTVIRAGIGQFSDLYPGTILDRFTTNFPQVTSFSYNASGSNFAFTDPNAATTGVVNCNTAFQSVYHSGGNLADFNTTPGCAGQTPGLNSVGKLLNPKYTEWNVEIQRTIGSRTVVSANYVGNRGYDGLLINPYLNTFAPDGFGGLPTSPVDQRVGNVSDLTNSNTSNYNGITLSVQENMWHGFMGRFNYSYSHALDDVSNGGILPYAVFIPQVLSQINPTCLRCNNYSNADYDLRHNITANYVYQMPFHSENRLVDAALGGWTMSGTVYFHTGFPFSLEDASDFNNEFAGNFGGGGVLLAQPITPVQNSCQSPNVQCYSLAQFAGQPNPALSGPCNPCLNPAPTGFGDVRRNSYRGPNYFNTDFSLRKNFRVTERMGLQLGANAYNVLNHPNFQVPNNTTAFGSSFGIIQSTVSPPTTPYGSFAGSLASARILQVMAKFTF